MKTWISIILFSTFALLAFAAKATFEDLSPTPQAANTAQISDEAMLRDTAARCVDAKRDALRVNDTRRYLELVTDMSCHHAELSVYGTE